LRKEVRMKFRKILSAALKMKNFALLAAVLIVFYLTGYAPFILIGLAGYIFFVLQTLRDDRFIKEYAKKEKLENLQTMNEDCRILYFDLKSSLNRYEEKKVIDVLQEKDEIMNSFYKGDDDPLRQKIVEQVLNLVMAYIKLVHAYSTRCRDLGKSDINEVMDRINSNSRKLSFINDTAAIEDLKKALEMDQSIVNRVQEQKNELEKTSARLDYMESTISMFKHRFISREDSDEAVSEIENAINEAAALDNTLNSSKKDRLGT
jgi:hypothetical protein